MSALTQPQNRVAPRNRAGPAAYRWALGVTLFILGLYGGLLLLLGLGILVPQFPVVSAINVVFWAVVAAVMWWLILKASYFRQVSSAAQIAAFFWGGIIATGVASVVNSELVGVFTALGGAWVDWSAAIVAPIVEETIKCLGVLVVFLLLRKPLTPVDGFVIGALVGLGFQIFEDFAYALQGAWQSGGDSWAAIQEIVLIRLLTIPASHWIFSGVAGIGLAYAFSARGQTWVKRLGVAALLGLLAVGFHFVWNTPFPDNDGLILLLLFIKLVAIFVLGMLVLRWARNLDGAFYTRYLVDVDSYFVTQAERVSLARGRWRRKARRAAKWQPMGLSKKGVKKLQRAQAKLAVSRAVRRPDQLDQAVSQIRGLRASEDSTVSS